jgi:hypothetical protein
VNPENIPQLLSLLGELLDTENYDHIIAKLGDAYDVEVLFDFFFNVKLSVVCVIYHP